MLTPSSRLFPAGRGRDMRPKRQTGQFPERHHGADLESIGATIRFSRYRFNPIVGCTYVDCCGLRGKAGRNRLTNKPKPFRLFSVKSLKVAEVMSWLGKRSYATRVQRFGIERIQEIARQNGKKGGRPRKEQKTTNL